jgi:hydroxylamine reductase (hybrid-cluster protein)
LLCLLQRKKSNFNFRAKKPREEFFETSYSETQDYSPAHAVEYLIETDHDNNESRIENEEDEEEQTEMIFQATSGDDEQQIQEITHDQIENDISAIKSEEQVAQTVFAYETRVENEIETTPHEEITYQESFVNETQSLVPSELDSWLNSLKQTLLVRRLLIQF